MIKQGSLVRTNKTGQYTATFIAEVVKVFPSSVTGSLAYYVKDLEYGHEYYREEKDLERIYRLELYNPNN